MLSSFFAVFPLADPFTSVEFYAFRFTLLTIFILWLYRAVKHEIKRGR